MRRCIKVPARRGVGPGQNGPTPRSNRIRLHDPESQFSRIYALGNSVNRGCAYITAFSVKSKQILLFVR